MNTLTPYLSDLKLGDVQQTRNMSVVPLFVQDGGGPEYITMDEALERGCLKITEKGEEGSIPELIVHNEGDLPVLLTDGAEVAGAKQNRIVNTTILIKEKSTTTIPVSCTESGRWSYRSPEFFDSKNVLYSLGRAKTSKDVSEALHAKKGFRSDQGAVWQGIEELMADVGATSASNAMRDGYLARRVDIRGYIESVPVAPGQNGLMVFVDGRPVGYDVVSRPEAYARLHERLITSYSMDAMRSREPDETPASVDEARKFLFEASEAAEQEYESVGHGSDHRFTGQRIVGSALIHQDTVIHSAFFRKRGAEQRQRAGTASARVREYLQRFRRRGGSESPDS